MLLNPEQESGVPGVEPRDRVVFLHLGRERVHVVILGTTDQSLQILQNKEWNGKKSKRRDVKMSKVNKVLYVVNNHDIESHTLITWQQMKRAKLLFINILFQRRSDTDRRQQSRIFLLEKKKVLFLGHKLDKFKGVMECVACEKYTEVSVSDNICSDSESLKGGLDIWIRMRAIKIRISRRLSNQTGVGVRIVNLCIRAPVYKDTWAVVCAWAMDWKKNDK